MGKSYGKKGFFTLKSNGKKLSCSICGVSFSSNGDFGISASLSLFSTKVESFINLSRSSITFGISVSDSVKQNGKEVYIGIKFAISISYLTIAAMAAIGVVCSIYVPALAPVITKIFASIANFVSNPYALSAGTTAIVGLMKAIA